MSLVSVHNEWDPLEEMIVGIPDNARVPTVGASPRWLVPRWRQAGRGAVLDGTSWHCPVAKVTRCPHRLLPLFKTAGR
jgi:hypothetical protein